MTKAEVLEKAKLTGYVPASDVESIPEKSLKISVGTRENVQRMMDRFDGRGIVLIDSLSEMEAKNEARNYGKALSMLVRELQAQGIDLGVPR